MVYKYRDAKDGQYVTQKYAQHHPATTVRERDPSPKGNGNGGKGKKK